MSKFQTFQQVFCNIIASELQAAQQGTRKTTKLFYKELIAMKRVYHHFRHKSFPALLLIPAHVNIELTALIPYILGTVRALVLALTDMATRAIGRAFGLYGFNHSTVYNMLAFPIRGATNWTVPEENAFLAGKRYADKPRDCAKLQLVLASERKFVNLRNNPFYWPLLKSCKTIIVFEPNRFSKPLLQFAMQFFFKEKQVIFLVSSSKMSSINVMEGIYKELTVSFISS